MKLIKYLLSVGMVAMMVTHAGAQIDTLVAPPKTYFYVDWDELTGAENGANSGSSTCEAVAFGGHTYSVVAIGNQCWFGENLQTQVFVNGDSIPSGLDDATWSTTDSAAMHENASNGHFYNWYAAVDGRGICPSGWKVPSNQEWYVLGEELGAFGGADLKSTSWDGTNSSGFNAVATGWKAGSGSTADLTSISMFWTRTPLNNGNAANIYLQTARDFIERDNFGNPVRSGFSIRCLKE